MLPFCSAGGPLNASSCGNQHARCGYSQFWHNLPINPEGQLHDPLCLSHTPPFSQAGQVSVHPEPQKPSGHTVERGFLLLPISSYKNKCVVVVDTQKSFRTHSSHSAFLPSPRDTCIVPTLCHMGSLCSCRDGRSQLQTSPLDSLTQDTQESTWEDTNIARGQLVLCRATYPDHSFLRDDQEGIFVGTLQ